MIIIIILVHTDNLYNYNNIYTCSYSSYHYGLAPRYPLWALLFVRYIHIRMLLSFHTRRVFSFLSRSSLHTYLYLLPAIADRRSSTYSLTLVHSNQSSLVEPLSARANRNRTFCRFVSSRPLLQLRSNGDGFIVGRAGGSVRVGRIPGQRNACYTTIVTEKGFAPWPELQREAEHLMS